MCRIHAVIFILSKGFIYCNLQQLLDTPIYRPVRLMLVFIVGMLNGINGNLPIKANIISKWWNKICPGMVKMSVHIKFDRG